MITHYNAWTPHLIHQTVHSLISLFDYEMTHILIWICIPPPPLTDEGTDWIKKITTWKTFLGTLEFSKNMHKRRILIGLFGL